MRTRLAALITTGLLTAAPLALTSAPAQAAECTAPEVLGTEVLPRTVVVGTRKVKTFDVYTDVETLGCTISSVKLKVSSPKISSGSLTMKRDVTSSGVSSYVYGFALDAGSLRNDEAGTWRAVSTTRWSGDPITSRASFRVLRAARLTTNATPEPVRSGDALVVRGTLTRAHWEKARYLGYLGRQVRLQFRPTGGAYADVATVTSRDEGRLKKTLTATEDGCFRFVYTGSSTTRGATAVGDCVEVR